MPVDHKKSEMRSEAEAPIFIPKLKKLEEILGLKNNEKAFSNIPKP